MLDLMSLKSSKRLVSFALILCSVEFYRYIFTEEKDSCIRANLDCSAFFDILI